MHMFNDLHTGLREAFWNMGWGVVPMGFWHLLTVLIVLDRCFVLFVRSSSARPLLVGSLKIAILKGELAEALRICAGSKAPYARVVSKGLAVLHSSTRHVQGELDAAALGESARLSARTRYLPVLANLSLLTGILVTMLGMGRWPGCCCCGESCDPGQKARILAEAISESLSCTAFGLGVAVVSIGAYAILQSRTRHLHDELSSVTVQLVNLALAQRAAPPRDIAESGPQA